MLVVTGFLEVGEEEEERNFLNSIFCLSRGYAGWDVSCGGDWLGLVFGSVVSLLGRAWVVFGAMSCAPKYAFDYVRGPIVSSISSDDY